MKKIRFATIGSNFIVDRFVAAAELHGHLAYEAVYSRTFETGRKLADTYGVAKVYTTLLDVAKDPEIDFVYVASPNHVHASQSILMMEYGKHVICEKPIASHHGELVEMEAAARKNKVILMEAMKSVHCPGYAALRSQLPKLGKVRNVTLSFMHYTESYDAYLAGKIENIFNPELSNGALVDLGVYPIHMLLSLFGMPLDIHANAIMLSTKTDASGTVACHYGDFLATLQYSKLATYEGNQIAGEKATMIVDKISDIKHLTICYPDGQKEEIPIEKKPVMYYEIAVFLDAIARGEQDGLLDVSHKQMQFLDAARDQLGIVFPADATRV